MRHSATRSLLSSGTTSSSWRASPASTASVRRRPTTAWCSTWKRGWRSPGTSASAAWSRSSTSATTSISTAAPSGSAGDIVEIFPAYEEEQAIRIEFFGDEIESISEIDPLRGKIWGGSGQRDIYPGSHYVTPRDTLKRPSSPSRRSSASGSGFCNRREAPRGPADRGAHQFRPRDARGDRLLPGDRKLLPPPDRPKAGRAAADAPRLLSANDLVIIDESHVTVPQIEGMFRGDRSRKETLVEYGFRLPSALDNRPLIFEEFERVAQGSTSRRPRPTTS